MSISHAGGNQLAVGYTSVSIALIGILVYHIFLQLRSTKLWKKVPELNYKFNRPNREPAGRHQFNRPNAVQQTK